ncbi:MAG: RagB/SusD family nutrient uptake outer membrane protein [Bacteroidota bacterium]
MKKIILITSIVFIFGSCDDFLELEPQQSLPSSTAFSTAADLQTAIIGAYDAAQASDFAGTNITMAPEVIADNGDWRGSFTSYRDIQAANIVPDNVDVEGVWQNGYAVINITNQILVSLDVIEDPELTNDLEAQLRGEALFLRGMAYFEMVRFYARPFSANSGSDLGLVLSTEPINSPDQLIDLTRSSVQATYDRAIADLTDASTTLPLDFIVDGRANRFAALAYLAEIAFQQRLYGEAANFADQVISSDVFSLVAEPNIPFINEFSDESIFEISHTIQDNPGVNGSLATFHHVNGRGGDLVISNDLIENGFDQIVTDDQQAAIDAANLTVEDLRVTQLTSNEVFNIEKYEDFTNNADNAIIWRLAELMLMRAESLVRLNGVNMESISLLNEIRLRSLRITDASDNSVSGDGLITFSTTDFGSSEELIEAIILERRVEMAFEGQRYHDLVRLERSIRGTNPGADNLVWPIPLDEVNSSGIEQNPGY